jgi:hypothetical protein
VAIPTRSVRIGRYRVIRRDDPSFIKVARNEVMMVGHESLPGIYVARIVANCKYVKNRAPMLKPAYMNR